MTDQKFKEYSKRRADALLGVRLLAAELEDRLYEAQHQLNQLRCHARQGGAVDSESVEAAAASLREAFRLTNLLMEAK